MTTTCTHWLTIYGHDGYLYARVCDCNQPTDHDTEGQPMTTTTDAAAHTLTTTEAATHLGVSPITIRRWVMKGWLTPLQAHTRPLHFHPADVRSAHLLHRPAYHRALDTLWTGLLASEDPHTER